MSNLEQALQQAASKLDAAIKRELELRKHNKSGRLTNSVKTDVVRSASGFTLKTKMEEYGSKLNERSRFLDAAIMSEEDAINRMIENGVYDDLNNFLDHEL